ncbi:GNAT family N-acetyltransferase [Patiriisocius sp. Uisw_017]|jgi:ElaA protein|uniref:GNAT family N-acetyltransferase n=1 Tax=Patiriisocius sp. Uisw_017 TaxID=3230968 RepID=UPI0039EB4A27
MKIAVKTFQELNTQELYDLLQLRSEVFVVEQDCVYQDIDGKDLKALHIIGVKDDKIVAYTRCFAPGIYFEEAAIGRVVVPLEERKYGYGHDIMKASIKAISGHYDTQDIKLSGQEHLKKFYESHGFKQIGEGYLEDGIPHIAMVTA